MSLLINRTAQETAYLSEINKSSKKVIPFQWEELHRSDDKYGQVVRAKVIGGWLISSVIFAKKFNMAHESMVFIADPNHEWEVL